MLNFGSSWVCSSLFLYHMKLTSNALWNTITLLTFIQRKTLNYCNLHSFFQTSCTSKGHSFSPELPIFSWSPLISQVLVTGNMNHSLSHRFSWFSWCLSNSHFLKMQLVKHVRLNSALYSWSNGSLIDTYAFRHTNHLYPGSLQNCVWRLVHLSHFFLSLFI